MEKLTKKERVQRVFELKEPDCVPVFPRNQAQMIYAMGWQLSDVSGQDWYDSEKSALASLWCVEHIDYDVAYGCYYDMGFGVPLLGGVLNIPDKFGMSVQCLKHPVETKADWNEIKKKLPLDPLKDPRMKGALKSLKYVQSAIGHHTPVTPFYYTGICAANLLFMDVSNLSELVVEDPEWVDEMCRCGSDFAMDWIRAQYEHGGLNTWLYLCDFWGTELMSPAMAERFVSPYVVEMSKMVEKEFGQRTFYHVHGNLTRPKSMEWIEKLTKDANLIGLHLDKSHGPEWIKEVVNGKMGVAGGLPFRGGFLDKGPIEKIREECKRVLDIGAPGGGVIVVPTGQVLPSTSNENFREWVRMSHEYGSYPFTPKDI